MKFIYIRGDGRFVYPRDTSVPPRPPTEEERLRIRQLAEAYDEAEHERVQRLAFPRSPPEPT